MTPPADLAPHLFSWLLVTSAHFLLTAHWTAAIGRPDPTADDRWFDTALAGVGSLAVVLHVVAAIGGLSFGAAVAGLALWHLAVAASRHVAGRAQAPAGEAARAAPPPVVAALEIAAAAVLAGIVLVWIDTAAASLAVTGADAAHYHVPVAVNLALGASPLDLPATQHLYPMATSTLAAWFVLATGDLQLVDLTMALPFALVAGSVAMLFRLAAGRSGLAWTTWPLLALFATPMFRASSLLSADLLFAGAFMAAFTQLLRMWARGSSGAWDVVLAGLALGLLMGSKATGIPAAALLLVAWLVLIVATGRGRLISSAGPVAAWPVAALLAAGAGGIWMIRNWMLFGSPIAPNGLTILGVEVFRGPAFEATTYLSVLGDVASRDAYSPADRASRYIGEWFGPLFAPWLILSLLVPVDAWLAARRGRAAGLAATRAAAFGLAVVVTVPLLWLLVGAPWTSLEWTRGYSLRYALPLAVLLPALSFIACFPLAWRWDARPAAALAAGVVLGAGGLWALATAQAADAGSPRLTGVALAAGLAVATMARARRRRAGRRPQAVAGIAGAALAIAFLATPFVAAHGERLSSGPPGAVTPASRAVLAAVLEAESTRLPPCPARRFYALTRFDEPLALQSGRRPDAMVFYAAREVEAAARAGPLGACDYVIATPAVLATDKGAALLTALYPAGRVSQVADTGLFIVLAGR